MAKSKHKQAWFRAVRGSYLPANGTGLAIYLLYIAYLVALAVGWYANGHHWWPLLVYVVPLSIGAALVTQYVASKHVK